MPLRASDRRAAPRSLRVVRITAVAALGFLVLVVVVMPELAAEPTLRAPLRAGLAAMAVVFILAAWGFEVADPPGSALRRDMLWGIGAALLAFVGLGPLLR